MKHRLTIGLLHELNDLRNSKYTVDSFARMGESGYVILFHNENGYSVAWREHESNSTQVSNTFIDRTEAIMEYTNVLGNILLNSI